MGFKFRLFLKLPLFQHFSQKSTHRYSRESFSHPYRLSCYEEARYMTNSENKLVDEYFQ